MLKTHQQAITEHNVSVYIYIYIYISCMVNILGRKLKHSVYQLVSYEALYIILLYNFLQYII